jgi:hypothetical protein
MDIRFSPQTIEALVQVIWGRSGGSIKEQSRGALIGSARIIKNPPHQSAEAVDGVKTHFPRVAGNTLYFALYKPA